MKMRFAKPRAMAAPLMLSSLEPTPMNSLEPEQREQVVIALARLLMEAHQASEGVADEPQ